MTVGFRRTAQTRFAICGRYRETGKFILASLFFTDGITTVISFSAIYATTTFHFTSGDVVILFLVLNVVAFPGALAAGLPRRSVRAEARRWSPTSGPVGGDDPGGRSRPRTERRSASWPALAALGMGSTQAVGAIVHGPDHPAVARVGVLRLLRALREVRVDVRPACCSDSSPRRRGASGLAVLSLLPFFLVGPRADGVGR